jgi:hypothetical protein
MALFEYKNIESFYGNDSNILYTALIAISSVAFGFLLSEFASYYRAYKKREKAGRLFQNELSYLKEPLKKQINSNKNYLNKIKTFDFNNSPEIYIQNLEFINFSDKENISEFYLKHFGKDSYKKLRITYNCFVIIDSEIKIFLDFFKTFNNNLTVQYEYYKNNANKFTRAIADYAVYPQMGDINNDSFFKKVNELAENKLNKERINPMQLKISLHEKLLDREFFNTTHPLFIIINEFNKTGFDIITNIETIVETFFKKASIINENLISCFETIYEEKIVEEN